MLLFRATAAPTLTLYSKHTSLGDSDIAIPDRSYYR